MTNSFKKLTDVVQRFMQLDEAETIGLGIRRHLCIELSTEPMPGPNYSFASGKDSYEAILKLLEAVKTRPNLPRELMNVLLEELDFEREQPLSIAYIVRGNTRNLGSLSAEPILVDLSEEELSMEHMEDGELRGLVTEDSLGACGIPALALEELEYLILRQRPLHVEARLDLAAITLLLLQAKPELKQ